MPRSHGRHRRRNRRYSKLARLTIGLAGAAVVVAGVSESVTILSPAAVTTISSDIESGKATPKRLPSTRPSVLPTTQPAESAAAQPSLPSPPPSPSSSPSSSPAPKPASTPPSRPSPQPVTTTTTTPAPVTPNGAVQQMASGLLATFGFPASQWSCLNDLWTRESGWDTFAENPSSGAYGIPQALPGDKMSSAGADWRTNPLTQIRWGLGYIKSVYGTPCAAWDHELADDWY